MLFLNRVILLFSVLFCSCGKTKLEYQKWENWYRPVDNSVFTFNYGNNHDPIIFVDSNLEYPYHLLVSGWGCTSETNNLPLTYLWRSKKFSWSADNWELVSKNYEIGCYYEYDDGVKVDNKYYIYEEGEVFTLEGDLDSGSGKWIKAGTFPKHLGDDVGVFYEDGIFHLFGEYGDFPNGPDGTSLSHLTSKTGIGDWILEDAKAVNPNLDNDNIFGVGDATIIKIENEYYLYCDLESEDKPYRIVAWKSESLYEKFEYLGVAISPRENESDDMDNYRIQDGDIVYVPEISKYIIVCNMMDMDGNPDLNFPRLENFTRVVGFLYSDMCLE
ncbi:MAG: hypothetical protein ACI93N_001491 [Flavobacteriaceae bacterium]|jgi:hypothetical protein